MILQELQDAVDGRRSMRASDECISNFILQSENLRTLRLQIARDECELIL